MKMNPKTVWAVVGIALVVLAAAYLTLSQKEVVTDGGAMTDVGGGTATNTDESVPVVQETQYVNVFFIEVAGEGGKPLGGEPVGCGDAVVPMKWGIAPTQGVLRAALEELIELGVRDIKANEDMYYNALYQSELKVDSAKVENGVAEVRLSGKVVSGGACDDPRIVAQIKKTVEQFPTVKSSKIYINNTLLESYFSER